MIKIDSNKNLIVTDDDLFIGYTGDNLNVTKEILIEKETDISLIYRMYLKFDDGTCNFFLLDKTESDNGTKLIWKITSDQIYKDGIVKVQIKASNSSGEVFHTNSINMLVQSSIEFCDSFAEKKVSEYLQHEERLNQIVRKGQEIYDNLSPFEFDTEPTKDSDKLISSGAVYNSLSNKANIKNTYYNPGGTGGLGNACDTDTIYNVCFNAPCNNVAQGTKGILFATDENTQILITDNGNIFYRYYNLTDEEWGDFNSIISKKVGSVNGIFPDKLGNVDLLVECGYGTDLADCTDKSRIYYFHSGIIGLRGSNTDFGGVGMYVGFVKKINNGWLFISSGDGNKKSNYRISENGETKLIGSSYDYNDLSNKPKVNNVEITGNKTLSELGLYSKEEVDEIIANQSVSGSGSLNITTQSVIDSNAISSATYYYVKQGEVITLFCSIKFNQSTCGFVGLNGLPFNYNNKAGQLRICTASSKSDIFRVSVSGSMLYISSSATARTQDEELNFSITYLV